MFTLLYCEDIDIPVTSLPTEKCLINRKLTLDAAIELRKELDYTIHNVKESVCLMFQKIIGLDIATSSDSAVAFRGEYFN